MLLTSSIGTVSDVGLTPKKGFIANVRATDVPNIQDIILVMLGGIKSALLTAATITPATAAIISSVNDVPAGVGFLSCDFPKAISVSFSFNISKSKR